MSAILRDVVSESELESYLHEQIPLSKAMGVRVCKATPEEVRLHVPLQPNLNHRRTVFGGSASAAATLAAWCLLYVRLTAHQARPELVIQSNTTQYSRPITSDFVARTLPVAEPEWERFSKVLGRKGRGRIEIRSVLEADGQICCEFQGRFVALCDDHPHA